MNLPFQMNHKNLMYFYKGKLKEVKFLNCLNDFFDCKGKHFGKAFVMNDDMHQLHFVSSNYKFRYISNLSNY